MLVLSDATKYAPPSSATAQVKQAISRVLSPPLVSMQVTKPMVAPSSGSRPTTVFVPEAGPGSTGTKIPTVPTAPSSWRPAFIAGGVVVGLGILAALARRATK